MSDDINNQESYTEEPVSNSSSATGSDSKIGRYKLVNVLGVGGMGQVWKARDQFNNNVALKMMLPGNATVQSQIQRFRREADIMAKLPHRNICRIFEVGEVDGLHYISMELVEGITLEDLLHVALPQGAALQHGKEDIAQLVNIIAARKVSDPNYKQHPIRRVLSVPTAIALMIKICDAVQFAHEHGVLHRDLKPGNIMLREDGEPMVMDFGLGKLELDEHDASLTMSGFMLGTMQYMSPEQSVSSKQVGAPTDVYSLGAIFYQMITGRHHFKVTGSLVQDAQSLQDFEPIPPGRHQRKISRDMETIVLKALSARVEGRYKTPREFAEDLRRYSKGDIIRARPQTLIGFVLRYIKRHLMGTALFSTVLIAGAIATGIIFYVLRQEAKIRQTTQMEEKIKSEKTILQLQQKAKLAQEEADKNRKAFEEAKAREDQAKKKESEAKQMLQAAQKEREEAKKLADEALKKMQANISPLSLEILTAKELFTKKDWRSSMEHIQKALSLDPKSIEALFLKARLHAAVFDLRGAALCIEEARKTGKKISANEKHFENLVLTFASVLHKTDRPWQDTELQRAFTRQLKSSNEDQDTQIADFLSQADVKLMESASTPPSSNDASEPAEITLKLLSDVPQMRPKEVELRKNVILEMQVKGEKVGKATAPSGQKVLLKNIQGTKIEVALPSETEDSTTSAWIDHNETNLLEIANCNAANSTRRTTRQSLIDGPSK